VKITYVLPVTLLAEVIQ